MRFEELSAVGGDLAWEHHVARELHLVVELDQRVAEFLHLRAGQNEDRRARTQLANFVEQRLAICGTGHFRRAVGRDRKVAETGMLETGAERLELGPTRRRLALRAHRAQC